MPDDRLVEVVEQTYIDFASTYHILDFPLLSDVFAVIQIESNWNPKAESPYARGLMQVSEVALEDIGRLYMFEMEEEFGRLLTYDDMFDPKANVWVGIRYLRRLYRAFLDTVDPVHNAIRAYNWGVGNVRRWLESNLSTPQIIETLPKETADYVHKFDWWREKYSKI